MKKTLSIIGALVFSTLLCFFVALIFKTSITVLGHVHIQDFSLKTTSHEIKKGDRIQVVFKAYENNLGAISLQLKNYNTNEKKDEHQILFHIKEKGMENWETEHIYFGGQFHDLDHFPFGFSPITNSKNKEYIAEVISLDGTSQSQLILKDSYPEFISYYQFSKHELFSPMNAGRYLLQKILFALSIPDFLIIILICYLPFVFILFIFSSAGEPFYALMSRTLNRTKKQKRKSYVYVVMKAVFQNKAVTPLIALMIVDAIFMKTSYSFVSYIMMSLVGICLILKKTTSGFLYYVAFIFAICVIIFSMVNLIDSAEKMAGWVVWILIISVLYDMLWQKNHK